MICTWEVPVPPFTTFQHQQLALIWQRALAALCLASFPCNDLRQKQYMDTVSLVQSCILLWTLNCLLRWLAWYVMYVCVVKKNSVTCKDANHGFFFTHYPRSLSVSSHRMCNHAGFTHTSKEANKHIYIFIYMFFYFVYLRNSVFMDDLVKLFCRSIVYDMGHCMCRFFKLTPYLRSAWHHSALSWHLTQDHSDFHEAELRLSHQATL